LREKVCRKSFSGKIWEILEKYAVHSNKVLSPTPMIEQNCCQAIRLVNNAETMVRISRCWKYTTFSFLISGNHWFKSILHFRFLHFCCPERFQQHKWGYFRSNLPPAWQWLLGTDRKPDTFD